MKVKSYVGEYVAETYSDFSFLDEINTIEKKFFIIDQNVYQLYQEVLGKILKGQPNYIVVAEEENKNIETALAIIERMIELESKRNTVLIAIGGGIVQDIAAFIANIIYRGINWILIPTTLLAQADSCIGSKTSLNFKQYKNIMGYFYPPQKIYINTNFVNTLLEKDYYSGLGEIMKCAIMAGFDSFQSTSSHIDLLKRRDEKVLQQEITKALMFKKSVIERDEFDRDFRNIMNYGHTFGHALETTSGYDIPHGQGVSFGMMIANEISCARGYISEQMKVQLNKAIKEIVHSDLIKAEYFDESRYLPTLRKDKKYTGGKHTCILFNGDSVARYSDIKDEEIVAAINNMLGKI